MARVSPSATLPIVEARGTHAAIGAAIGTAHKRAITVAAKRTATRLWEEQGLNDARLAAQQAPQRAHAERLVPHLVEELRARAVAAGVSFEILSYLSAGGHPGGQTAVGGCTSVGVRGPEGTFLVAHTEDSLDPENDSLFLLRAAVDATPAVPASSFLSLCLVHSLPGCTAAVNGHGMAVLVDWLPDPEPGPGLTFDYVTRALLDLPSIDAALEFLRATPRHGGGNCLLAQGERLVNVELASKHMAVVERSTQGVWAHTNHFIDAELAALVGPPDESSPARLARAQRLARPGQTLDALQTLLADEVGAPLSICRAETLAGFVADPARREVRVAWGEPAHGTWATHTL